MSQWNLSPHEITKLANTLGLSVSNISTILLTRNLTSLNADQLKLIIKLYRAKLKDIPGSRLESVPLSGKKKGELTTLCVKVLNERCKLLGTRRNDEKQKENIISSSFEQHTKTSDKVWESEEIITKTRSPFHPLRRVIGELKICRETHSPKKRLEFTLSNEEFDAIRYDTLKTALNTLTLPRSKTLSIHLRLYSNIKKEIVCFTPEFSISVNTIRVNIRRPPEPKKNSKKRFKLISPLDITHIVRSRNSVCIECFDNVFVGVVGVELVETLSLQQLISAVNKRGLAKSLLKSPKALPAPVSLHACAHCNTTEDVSRCSRCRKVYYCSRDHQRKDWLKHQFLCKDYRLAEAEETIEETAAEPTGPGNTGHVIPGELLGTRDSGGVQDDDIECTESIVMLTCPLSLNRIETAVRGENCSHLACFDLKTYLDMSKQMNTWECPLCASPLPFSELVVDGLLTYILGQVPENAKSVRLSEGKFEVVEEEEETRKREFDDMSEDEEINGVKRMKLESDSDDEPRSAVYDNEADPILLD